MIDNYLRDVIVSRINDLFGEQLDTIFSLPENYDELAVEIRGRLKNDFSKYGMELSDLFINSITPPPEVQKMIDERSGMSAVGNLDAFMKFKAAKAIGDAARSGGGGTAGEGAAAGMGLGLGAGLGMMLPGMIYKSMNPNGPSSDIVKQKGFAACPDCHAEIRLDGRFCHRCGHQLVIIKKCPQCEKNLSATANFCSNCGYNLKTELKCSNCNSKLLPGTKFCPNCGESVIRK